MKDIKSSNIVKAIAYTVVPILTLIIILYLTSLVLYANYEEDYNEFKDYSQTQRFADEYWNNINRAISITVKENKIMEKEKEELLKAIDKKEYTNLEVDSYYNEEQEIIQYNFYSIQNYDILVIFNDDTIITNVEKTINTDTKDKIIKYNINDKSVADTYTFKDNKIKLYNNFIFI